MPAHTFPHIGLTNTYATWVNTYSQVVTTVNTDVLRLGGTVTGFAARSNSGSITANTSSVDVIGTGTRFLEQLQVGDIITTSGPTQARAIVSIISNVELTVNTAFTTAVSANTFTAAGSLGTLTVSNTVVTFGNATANVTFSTAGAVVSSNTVTASGFVGSGASLTGVPISTGVSGLGTDVATALGINLGSTGAVTTWGSSPTFGTVTAALIGNASTATNVALGGITGLGTNVATALGIAVGSSGAFTTWGSDPTFGTVTAALVGNASTATLAATATNVALGGITGLGTGVATALAINTGTSGAITTWGSSPTFNTTTLTTGSGSATIGVNGNGFIAQPTTVGLGAWLYNGAGSGYIGVYTDGNVGVGTLTPAAKLHVYGTTQQLRLGYDASNYFATTVGSTGGVTFDAVGAGAEFAFSDAVSVAGTLTATTFSGSGTSLTSIPESAISDGSILARLAANETVTGKWLFNSTATDAINISGAVSIGGQSSSIAAGDLSVARSATTGYINFGTNAGVYLERNGGAFTVAGATLAWGGGSAISSSSNVALLNAANVFTVSSAFPLSLVPSTTTSYAVARYSNAGGDAYIGTNGSGAADFFVGGTAYATVIRAAAGTPIEFGISTTKSMSLSAAGNLTVSGSGTHIFGGGGTSSTQDIIKLNGSSASSYGPFFILAENNTPVAYIGTYKGIVSGASQALTLQGITADGVNVYATHASGDVRLYSRNTLALTLGASQAATFTGLLTVPVGILAGTSGWNVFAAGDGTYGAYVASNTTTGNLSTINQPAMRLLGDGTTPIQFQTSPATSVGASRTWTTRMSLTEAGLLTVTGATAGGTVATLTSADAGTDTTLLLFQRGGGGVTGGLKYYNSLGNVMMLESSHSLGLRTAGVTALTLDASQVATFTNSVYSGGDIILPNTKRLYIDNGSDTYIHEVSANIGAAVAANVESFRWSSTYLYSRGDLLIDPAKGLFFDGGSNTYIVEGSADNLSTYVGGTRYLQLTGNQFYIQNSDLLVAPTKKFYLDGGGDTYVYEDTANRTWFVNGGVNSLWFNATVAEFGSTIDVRVGATKKLYFDGGGDTYIHEVSANAIDLVVAGGAEAQFRSGAVYFGGAYAITTASAANVFVASNGNLQRSTSSLRYKTDVQSFNGGLADVFKLEPVSFLSKADPTGPRHLGFTAEALDAAGFHNIVTYDGEGRPDAIQYDRLTTYLVNAIKELATEFDAYKTAHGEKPTKRRASEPDVDSRMKAIAKEVAMLTQRLDEQAQRDAAMRA